MDRRKFLIWEVGVMLAFQSRGVLIGAFGLMPEFSPGSQVKADSILYAIAHIATGIPIFLFVMYRSGSPLSDYGFKKPRWPADLNPLTFAAVSVVLNYAIFFYLAWKSGPGSVPPVDNAAPLWLIGTLCLAVGIAEETTFRGYLLARLEQLTGKTWIAIVGQAAIFGIGHSYQGTVGVLSATSFGLFMGCIVAKYRTLWPCMLLHSLVDFCILALYAYGT